MSFGLRALELHVRGVHSADGKPFGQIFERARNEEWLALEGDFRTLGISQIVTELPHFNQFLAP
jgi:hypothetical protein